MLILTHRWWRPGHFILWLPRVRVCRLARTRGIFTSAQNFLVPTMMPSFAFSSMLTLVHLLVCQLTVFLILWCPLSALVSLQIPVLTTPPQRGRGRGRCGQRGVSSSTPSLPSFGRGRVIDIAHRASKDIERIAQPRSMGRAPITARVSISDRVYEGHERLEHPTHLAPKDGVWAACERITRPQIVHIHRR